MAGGDAPIFVIGFQRSGTTLLQALLGAHPRIAAPPEVYFVGRVSDHADYFGDLSDDANLEAALHEALHPPLDMLAGCGFDEERLLARAKAGPRTYAGLLDAMLGDFAERQGKQRWAEKSAGQPLGPVLDLFPDAKAIHIVRDPRDTVASSMRTAWTTPDAADIARSWRGFVLETIARGRECGPGQYLQVRYEDLTRDPAAVLKVVCAFVDEAYDPAMLTDPARRSATVPDVAAGWQGRALEPVAAAREGEWAHHLSRRDQVRAQAVVGSLLMPLGYSPPDARTQLAALPLAALELSRRLRARAVRPPRALSPEERYRLKRRYLDAQAERVRAAEARTG